MSRLEQYKEILKNETINAEDKLKLLDMITQDITELESAQKTIADSTEEITRLRETNQQ